MVNKKYITSERGPFFEIAKDYITSDSKILDIGCGNCSFAKYIERFDTYCLDGNIESINSVKDTFENAVCAQLPNLPFEDNSFDVIHSSHVVEHLYPQELYDLLKEIDRCLKPGGHLIISAPTMWSGFYGDMSHIKPYYPIVFYKYLCGTRGKNTTRPIISNEYRCIKEVYRYHELPYENLEICLDNKRINKFLDKFNKFKYEKGIRKLEKSGYTIVLRKKGQENIQDNTVLYSKEQYSKKRNTHIYYEVVKDLVKVFASKQKSILDVGSANIDLMSELPFKERVSVSMDGAINNDKVKGYEMDFFKFEPEHKFDIVTCLQVIEHVEKAKEFTQKLLKTGKLCIISLPYKWDKDFCVYHCQDPVDEAKIFSWANKKPKFTFYVTENSNIRRIICVYGKLNLLKYLKLIQIYLKYSKNVKILKPSI